ncbi:hypothetical protein H110_09017, partial [Trichophyton rubrum MR1448]
KCCLAQGDKQGNPVKPGMDENRPSLIERPWNRRIRRASSSDPESNGQRDGRTRERVWTKELRAYLDQELKGGPR